MYKSLYSMSIMESVPVGRPPVRPLLALGGYYSFWSRQVATIRATKVSLHAGLCWSKSYSLCRSENLREINSRVVFLALPTSSYVSERSLGFFLA